MLENRHKDLLFKRGFLATGRNLTGYDSPLYEHVLASWRSEPVVDLVLYHDPSVDPYRHEGEGVEVALLGLAVDPVSGYADAGPVVERLHSSFLRSDEKTLSQSSLISWT